MIDVSMSRTKQVDDSSVRLIQSLGLARLNAIVCHPPWETSGLHFGG